MFAVVGDRIHRIISTAASPTKIDNPVFQLYYGFTAVALLVCSVLSTSTEHFGNPIDCISSSSLAVIPRKALTTYCWIHGTFTLEPDLDSYAAHPGVYKYIPDDEKLVRTHHLYYQWVCLVLLAQCISFYVPRYLWRLSENGLTKKLMSGETPALARYLVSHQDCHAFLGFTYHVCEIMNVLLLCGNFMLTDMLLNNRFRDLGWFALRGGDLARIFPRMGKCTFQMFGPTGEVESHDSLCLLAQNVFNEKIFFVLWFWYLFLGVLTIVNMAYGLILFLSVKARVHRISFVCASLSTPNHCANRDRRLRTVIQELHYGEFFVLRLLSKNMPAQLLPQLINVCYGLINESRKEFGAKERHRMRNDLYLNREFEAKYLLENFPESA